MLTWGRWQLTWSISLLWGHRVLVHLALLFPLLLSQSLQLEVFDLFSFSIKPTSRCCWSWSQRCSSLITLSGCVLLYTVVPLPVVCGLTPGCCRDDLIPVRICWSYSIMRHPKSATVDKRISLPIFLFSALLLVDKKVQDKYSNILLSAGHIAVSTLTLPLCRRHQQCSSHWELKTFLLSLWGWGPKPITSRLWARGGIHTRTSHQSRVENIEINNIV